MNIKERNDLKQYIRTVNGIDSILGVKRQLKALSEVRGFLQELASMEQERAWNSEGKLSEAHEEVYALLSAAEMCLDDESYDGNDWMGAISRMRKAAEVEFSFGLRSGVVLTDKGFRMVRIEKF